MPSSLSIAAFSCGAVLLVGVYHAVFVAPRLRAMAAAVARAGDVTQPSPEPYAPGFARGAVAAPAVAPTDAPGATVDENDVRDATARLAAIETVVARDLPHVSLRYNSFVDVGSDRSFTCTLLSSNGGIVVSSIFAREETPTYGKAVHAFVPQQDASQEKRAAIAQARREGAFVRA